MLTFREFDEANSADYESAVHIHNVAWPEDPHSVEEWKINDEMRDRKYYFQRYFVELDGEPIGYCQCNEPNWCYEPNKYMLRATLLPDQLAARCSETFDFLVGKALERGATSLMSMTREDQTPLVNTILDNGFSVAMRYPVSELTIAEFAFDKYEAVCQKVADAGIECVPLDVLQQSDPNWREKVWALDNEITKDVPIPGEFTPPSLEQYWKDILPKPAFRADGWFIARDNALPEASNFVGVTMIWVAPTQQEKVFTGLTGVRRDYRRKGIATALKVRAVKYAQSLGATSIQTDNEENNPMYALNMALGYRPKPAWVDYVKKLS